MIPKSPHIPRRDNQVPRAHEVDTTADVFRCTICPDRFPFFSEHAYRSHMGRYHKGIISSRRKSVIVHREMAAIGVPQLVRSTDCHAHGLMMHSLGDSEAWGNVNTVKVRFCQHCISDFCKSRCSHKLRTSEVFTHRNQKLTC